MDFCDDCVAQRKQSVARGLKNVHNMIVAAMRYDTQCDMTSLVAPTRITSVVSHCNSHAHDDDLKFARFRFTTYLHVYFLGSYTTVISSTKNLIQNIVVQRGETRSIGFCAIYLSLELGASSSSRQEWQWETSQMDSSVAPRS